VLCNLKKRIIPERRWSFNIIRRRLFAKLWIDHTDSGYLQRQEVSGVNFNGRYSSSSSKTNSNFILKVGGDFQ
jgi:hypothetical protein